MMNVLFVCTGNTCRSPMAEAILRAYAKDGAVKADSAGIYADEGAPMSPNAVEALKKMGVAAHGHRAKQITQQMAQGADLILTMTSSHLAQLCRFLPQHAHKVHTLKGFALGSGDCARCIDNDIADPYGGSAAVYQNSADEIAQYIRLALEKLS